MPGVFTLTVDSPALGAARLRLSGHLDDAGARELLHVAAHAVRCGCARLVVDLAELTGHDAQTPYALTGCARLGAYLPEGVAVVAGGDAGSELAERAGVVAESRPPLSDTALRSREGRRPSAGPDTLQECRAC